MRNLLRSLGLAVLLGVASGCKSDEPWTFAVTRTFWSSFEEADFESSTPDQQITGELAVCLIVCPIAIDVVLLPITLTRDLVIEDY